MGERLPISERFTLPESRTACRAGDIPVSTQEYRRLWGLEKTDDLVADVDLTQIIGGVAEGCKRVILRRCDDSDDGCDGPRAAKASALSKFTDEEDHKQAIIEGLNERVSKIGKIIVDKVISHFKDSYSVGGFLDGDFPIEDVCEERIPDMGPGVLVDFDGRGSMDGDEDTADQHGDSMSDLFLHKLYLFVQGEVSDWFRENLKVEFCGKSIWDCKTIEVRLRKSEDRLGGVDVGVLFRELSEKELRL